MGLDTKCDLASAAREPVSRRRWLCRWGDERPKDGGRRPELTDASLDLAVLGGAVSDPPEPWSTQLILQHAVPWPLRRRLSRRWLGPLVVAALAIAAWLGFRRWGGGAGDLRSLVGVTLVGIAARPAGTLLVALFYAVAGALFVPVTLLATATLAVFGPWPGVAIAWSGGLLGAMVSHAIGRRLGPRVVAWLPRRGEKGVPRFLERQSFWAVVCMRVVPLGNFGALNLAAGALGIRRRSFILGNMVGLLPGLCGLGVAVNRTAVLLYKPTPLNVVAFVMIVGGMVATSLWVRRRYKAGQRPRGRPSSTPSAVPPTGRASSCVWRE